MPEKHRKPRGSSSPVAVDCHAVIAVMQALAAEQFLRESDPNAALRSAFERVNVILDEIESKVSPGAMRAHHEAVKERVAGIFARIDEEMKREE